MSHKMVEILCIAEELLTSQEGLYSLESTTFEILTAGTIKTTIQGCDVVW